MRDRLVARDSDVAGQRRRRLDEGHSSTGSTTTPYPCSSSSSAARRGGVLAGDEHGQVAAALRGDVLQLEVLDVDPRRPERLGDPGEHARAVRHVHVQLLEVARVGERLGEQPAPVRRRLGDPAGEEAGVSRLEGLLELFDAAAVIGERDAHRGGVLEEDVDPDPRVRSRDTRHLAQRATGGRERVVAVDAPGSDLVGEQVRERVRQVAGQSDDAVVRRRLDRDRRRAQLGDEPVDEPVAGGVRLRDRGQEPGRALEQVGGRVLGPARLRPAHRVPADEAPRRRPPPRTTAAFVEPTSVTVQSAAAEHPGQKRRRAGTPARPPRPAWPRGAPRRAWPPARPPRPAPPRRRACARRDRTRPRARRPAWPRAPPTSRSGRCRGRRAGRP